MRVLGLRARLHRAPAIALAVLALLLCAPAWSQVPKQISYQGRLSSQTGPIEGNAAITFRLYNVASGGVALWQEAHASVPVSKGVFHVLLGSITPLELPFSEQYYLGVTVGGDAEMTPRAALEASGYAVRSAIAQSVPQISNAMIAPGAITPSKLALACQPGDTIRRGASGWECVPFCTPATEICDGKDNNCDGTVDEGWLIAGKYGTDQACGNCATDCVAIYAKPGASGTCDSSGTPQCVMNCQPGFLNLNGLSADGCEHALDATAIHVSTTDPGAADGGTCGLLPTPSPCKTISGGIARAQSIGRTQVRVADGVYDEAVVLVNGISVLGGHRPDTWARDIARTRTEIRGASASGNHDRTVIAAGITSATTFEGFVVRGALNEKSGGNSYAIYVSGSNANLLVTGNLILAGRGAPGMTGSSGLPGTAGANGTGRASNPSAYDAKIATGTGFCNTSNNRAYLNGGFGTCGVTAVSGGQGGGNRCAPVNTLLEFSGIDGSNGSGFAPGSGGDAGDDGRVENAGATCVVPAASMTGATGTVGAIGSDAAAAPGCAGAGFVSAGHWSAGLSTLGANGGNGSGGGGGGGGGGGFCASCAENKDRLGGHGGGGGSGGCGGGGGGAGMSGGGAFGIFVSGGSAPTVSGNTIVRGDGGPGAPGGSAGGGGFGGSGGTGGASNLLCAGAGGDGGAGGRGGHGAGGGGGCGGSSYGIFTSGIGSPNYCDAGSANSISGGNAGPGGAGGASSGNAGGAGAAGTVGACSFN